MLLVRSFRFVGRGAEGPGGGVGSRTCNRFYIDLGLTFDTFLHAENLKFYCFFNSFVAFRLFRKGIENH